MQDKLCRTCGEVKPLTEFHRKTRGLYQGKCKPCQASYLKEHYERYKERYFESTKRGKKRRTDLIREAKDVPCQDCGDRFHPCAMDFDHRDGDKEFGISSYSGGRSVSLVKLLAEMAKCDVVCANCHRVRTFNRRIAQGTERETSKLTADGSNPSAAANFTSM